MIRKWMSILVSLLLAIALPMSALADTQHTLSIVPGEMLASEEGIADLLNVLALRFTQGNKSGALTVLLNDQPMVTVGLSADTTGLYASSEMLGADVLYVTWDDAFALMSDLMQASMAEAGADKEAVEAMQTSLAQAKNSIINTIEAGVATAPKASMPASMEESLKTIEKMFPDDPEMVKYIQGLYEDITVEDGSFASEKRDTADQKYVMTMDEKDLLAICETNYMKTVMTQALAAENTEVTEEDLASLMDEVKKLYEESGFKMVMEMYTKDAGQTLVGMDMNTGMSIKEDDVSTDVTMTAVYDRLTGESGVSHKASAQMKVDDEAAKFEFTLDAAHNGESTGLFGMLVDEQEIVILYNAKNTAENVRERKADLYVRSDATAILQPSASDRPVIGVVVTTEPASADTLAALEKATADNSVNVLKLSDEEMQTLANQISTNAMQVFYSALSQLPTTTLNLLMGNEAAE